MLPAISNQPINDKSVQTVNARELHSALGVGKVFAAWIQARIDKFKFEEGSDYIILLSNSGNQVHGGANKKDFHITLNMAKELAMVENSDKGREVRKYFINCEQELIEQRKIASDPVIRAAETIPALVAAFNALGIKGNQAAIAADQTAKKHTGVSLLEDSGNTHLKAETDDRILTPTAIGKIIGGKSGAAINKALEKMGYQDKEDGQWRAIGPGEKHSVVMDTGKKSGGVPVTQMKWKQSVVSLVSDFLQGGSE